MARVLEDFDFRKRPHSRHPWDTWLDGQVWELRQGVDFSSEPPNMRGAAHAAAAKRGLTVRTSIRGPVLTLQAERKAVVVRLRSKP